VSDEGKKTLASAPERDKINYMARLLNLFHRMIQPELGDLSPEHAKYVLTLGFTQDEQERYLDLSEKVSDGTLTPDEQAELDDFLTVDAVLSLLQSKARRSLATTSSAA
jgi:hypothetical protein